MPAEQETGSPPSPMVTHSYSGAPAWRLAMRSASTAQEKQSMVKFSRGTKTNRRGREPPPGRILSGATGICIITPLAMRLVDGRRIFNRAQTQCRGDGTNGGFQGRNARLYLRTREPGEEEDP